MTAERARARWGVRDLEPSMIRRIGLMGGLLYIVAGLSVAQVAIAAPSGVLRSGAYLVSGMVACSVGMVALYLSRFTADRTLLRVYPPMAIALLFFAGLNITVGLYFAGLTRWSVGTMLYMLAPIFGFYLLTPRLAILVVAAVGVEYGWVLAVTDGALAPVANWVFVMAVLAATAFVIGGLVDWADRLATSERRAREELAEASRQKSAFMAAMSHELRTPMNAIIGFSEVLEQRIFGELNEKQAEYIHDVVGSGQHLLSLINDILDLSKIEAGRMELAIHDVDVAALVDHAVSFVRPQVARGNIALRVELDPEVGEVQADEQKLLQALINLLSNAVKFTPDGGAISVAARRTDGRVVIAVTDSGPGIAPADQERIFEEFSQAGPPADGRPLGTGLGLALAKRYTELHEGRLTVDSVVGAGSTFRLEVPAGA
jgi:signal transduction histidine kinase